MAKWKNDQVESSKEFVKKLAEFEKPITKSSQVENLAKCQTNSTCVAQFADCRIGQDRKLADLPKVSEKFWDERRLVLGSRLNRVAFNDMEK